MFSFFIFASMYSKEETMQGEEFCMNNIATT
jgi:hypothetical protein